MLTQDASTHAKLTLSGTACLVINDQALAMALGKPHEVNTFGEYEDVFVKSVFHMGASFDMTDIT